jgi:hypothetical protein
LGKGDGAEDLAGRLIEHDEPGIALDGREFDGRETMSALACASAGLLVLCEAW